MKEAYTISLYSDGSAEIKNYENIDDTLDVKSTIEENFSILIHVGDIWSEIGAFFKILHTHSGKTLITEDAMQQLSDEFTNTEKVTTYYESQTHRPVDVFSIQLQEQEVVSEAHEIVGMADISVGAETTTTDEWGSPDPFLQLQNAPDWLLDLRVSQLVQMKGRLENTFQTHDVQKVSDIMRYDAESML